MDLKQALERIDFFAQKLRQLQDDFNKLKSDISIPELSDSHSEMLLTSEKYRIEIALQLCYNRRKKAAKMLGMTERTFYRKLVRYKINETN